MLESYNEALAAVHGARLAVMVGMLPPELRDDARVADSTSNDDDVFGLPPDLAAVRIHRLPDERAPLQR